MGGQYQEPPLSQKAMVLISAAGWTAGAMVSAGAVAWCRTLRRLVRP